MNIGDIVEIRGIIKVIHQEEDGLLLRMMIQSHRFLFDDMRWIVCSPHAYKSFDGDATESPHKVGEEFREVCIVHAFNSVGVPIMGLFHTYSE